jgi:hypothetical protein
MWNKFLSGVANNPHMTKNLGQYQRIIKFMNRIEIIIE